MMSINEKVTMTIQEQALYNNACCCNETFLEIFKYAMQEDGLSDFVTRNFEGIALTNSLDAIEKADLYILAVSDDVISNISKKLPTDVLLIHTAGSVSIDVIKSHKRRGVWYPIQSFNDQQEIDFSEVTFGIETNKLSDKQLIYELTKSIDRD